MSTSSLVAVNESGAGVIVPGSYGSASLAIAPDAAPSSEGVQGSSLTIAAAQDMMIDTMEEVNLTVRATKRSRDANGIAQDNEEFVDDYFVSGGDDDVL
jgi:hypothetical protein